MTESPNDSITSIDHEEDSNPDANKPEGIIPAATYRLQLNQQFSFNEATRFVSYLNQLGISHCYVSPFLKARPGSNHGYDIVDHSEINPEIGGMEAFECYVAELHRHGMGLIADIVPNHMAIMGSDNNWWLDVLENGQASDYAPFFDIDWQPIKKAIQNKILLPVLGGLYGDTLEQQELKLVFDADSGEFSIAYHQHRFPIDPKTYPFILSSHHELWQKYFDPNDPVFLEYQSLENSFSKLPSRTDTTREKIEERKRDKEVFKKHLARLCSDQLSILQSINYRIAEINLTKDELGELHALLEQQVYRLANWRVASDEINYRRFFDINHLAGLRIEDEKVFDAAHRLILLLIGQGKIQGLRIDHADGLYDPVAYYERLNRKVATILPVDASRLMPPIYMVAEKIVANYEYLSSDWPIHGTTGYEFANIVNGVFIDPTAEPHLTQCYGHFIREQLDFGERVYQAKKLVMTTKLASELNVLANQLSKIADANAKTRDYTLNALRNALSEIIACFPVYRTYINNQSVCKKDSHYIHWAVEQGKQRSRAADKTVFDFIRNTLLLEHNTPIPASELLKFVMRFQQYTAPVMAKGYEDTALYQYHRLISLNEVGGDPRHFGNSVNAFHHFNQERLKKWPHSMLCLSTHDSKHSADMRARINVISEIPQHWQEAVNRWRRLNKTPKTKKIRTIISRNDEYLFYQVLLGTWPLLPLSDAEQMEYQDRIRNYMIKAVREAKQDTSWVDPNEEYEQAVKQFISRCLDIHASPQFLKDFTEFERQIRKPGLLNALAQTVLQFTSPGVPDLYQGNEFWQFHLADPDNRQPIEFNHHQQFLTKMVAELTSEEFDRTLFLSSLLDNMEDGLIKLFVVMLVLRFRQHHTALFQNGEYIKINVRGQKADHLLAFARKDQTTIAIILVPRLITSLLNHESDPALGDIWQDTWLELPLTAPSNFQELFSQCRVATIATERCLQLSIRDALALFPLAILSAEL